MGYLTATGVIATLADTVCATPTQIDSMLEIRPYLTLGTHTDAEANPIRLVAERTRVGLLLCYEDADTN